MLHKSPSRRKDSKKQADVSFIMLIYASFHLMHLFYIRSLHYSLLSFMIKFSTNITRLRLRPWFVLGLGFLTNQVKPLQGVLVEILGYRHKDFHHHDNVNMQFLPKKWENFAVISNDIYSANIIFDKAKMFCASWSCSQVVWWTNALDWNAALLLNIRYW